MSARRVGNTLLFLLSVGLVTAGAFLLFRDDDSAPPQPAAEAPPVEGSHLLRSDYVRRLTPVDAAEGRELLARFSDAQRRRFSSDSATAELLVHRTLELGQEFASRVRLRFRNGTPGRLWMETASDSGPTTTYLAQLGDGEITDLQVGADGEVRELKVEGELLISIGDLPLADGVRFYALDQDRLEPAGWLEDLGSKRLLVFAYAEPGENESALVYVEPEEMTLRAIRVFDGRQRLVRSYEDFRFDRSSEPWRLDGFRVSRPATGSHTVFGVSRMELGGPVEVPSELSAPPGGAS